MGWEEAAEEPVFAGSIDQYLGEELQFSSTGVPGLSPDVPGFS